MQNIDGIDGIEREHLSPAAGRLGEVLGHLVLASPRQLAGALGWHPPQLVDPIKELERHQLISCVKLGTATPGLRPASRWFLTVRGRAVFDGIPSLTWHEDENRAVLLGYFPVLDAFYEAVVQYRALGGFEEFLLLDRPGLDGAVRYQNGWIGLLWSGMLERSEELTLRFNRLYDDFPRLAWRHPDPWPAVLLVVVPDRWQRQVVVQAADDSPYKPMVAIYCAEDGRLTDAPQPADTRGWVRSEVDPRDDGGWTWDARLEGSIWTQAHSQTLYRMLRAIAEFPGMPLRLGRQTLGEDEGGKNAERACRTLANLGLVETIPDGNRLRFALSRSGRNCLVGMERGTSRHYLGRAMANSWVKKPNRRAHENGAMGLLGQFRAAGFPTAPGWRYYEDMRGRALAPDGMVHLNRPPYGPDWHFLEYERSARSPSAWRRKLRGLAASQRQNRWAALCVCFNKTAEGNLHQVAGELGLRVLTTTICRLEKHGPLETFECWSFYGHRVAIG